MTTSHPLFPHTHHYLAYGQRIASSLPLPELHAVAPAPPLWSFDVVSELPPAQNAVQLGEEAIYDGVAAHLDRHDSGYRIRIPDTGVFDLSEDGTRISWMPTSDPWWDFGRAHLLGRVLGTTLHLGGCVVLHGSAVEIAGGVVGFLAPKHFGKSTLSRTLFTRGARFVTDDALPVHPPSVTQKQAQARPGIQSLRIRSEDLDLVPAEMSMSSDASVGRDGKISLPPLPLDRVLTQVAPLKALYLLSPSIQDDAPDDQAACERTRLSQVHATLYLMGQLKIGAMLGPRFAGSLMQACSAITSVTPVYRLSVVRDLERIHEVAGQLEEWHQQEPASR